MIGRWGFRVDVPDRIREIRPLLHYGMLDLAKYQLRNVMSELNPYLERDTPVIFLEPSTAAVFRDELPALFPNNQNGRRLTKNTFLLSEFIDRENLPLPKLERKAIFHAHCHQKAVLNPDAERNVLRGMGIDFEEPWVGCYGMAGSFGFERGHYDISLRIAEEHLFPAVREAGSDTLVIADGFSCRTQIFDGTGRHALHLAEAILMAYEQAGELPPKREVVPERKPVAR